MTEQGDVVFEYIIRRLASRGVLAVSVCQWDRDHDDPARLLLIWMPKCLHVDP